MRQVDKSGSVAEERTPEIPDGLGESPAETVSWATAGPRAARRPLSTTVNRRRWSP